MRLMFLLTLLHAFYLSVIDIEVVDDRISALTVKVFTDDLVDAVRAEEGVIIPIDKAWTGDHNTAVEHYFENHLYIQGDNSRKHFTISSTSRESESTWIEFKTDSNLEESDVLVANYLMELFSTQVNMCKLNLDGTKKFIQIKKGNSGLELLHR